MHIPSAFYSTDLFWSGLQWLMILAIWCGFALSNWREDRKLRPLLYDAAKQSETFVLLRSLHRRDVRIWLQLSLLVIIAAANDLRHDANLLPADFFAAPQVAAPTPPPAPVKETVDENYDKLLQKNASATALPFSNITAFNEQNGKREAYIDWLKQHYESWLVTYYFLDKCKATLADDYKLIHESLQKELAGAHADGAVETNILTAASGSYKEMYSGVSCDGANLAATKSSYDANMQQLRAANPAKPAPDQPAVAAKPAPNPAQTR